MLVVVECSDDLMLPADMLMKVQFGPAPAWRACTDGLNVEGKCLPQHARPMGT